MNPALRPPAQSHRRHLTRRQMLTGIGVVTLSLLVGETRADAATGATPPRAEDPTLAPSPTPPTAPDQLRARLPKTAMLLDQVDTRGGGQLYVSLKGQRIANYAFGTTGTGAAITPDSLVPWASATKPTTCLAIMRLADAGRLAIDDPVTKYIPEFGVNGKGGVLIRHLLTHTGHLGGYDGPTQVERFDETVTKIVQAPLDGARPGMARPRVGPRSDASAVAAPPVPGTDPSYNPAGIWILGEILRRIHGVPFDQMIRAEMFLPMGMTDSWNGMPAEQFQAYGDRVVSGVGRINALQVRAATASQSNPAGGGVGPIRELARVYEMMLAGGTIDGTQIVAPQTAAEMTKVQATDGGIWTWGLGFNLNGNDPTRATNTGATAPANASGEDDPVVQRSRFGQRASPQTFGHPGATGTIAFADPLHGLIVAMIGLPAAIADAIYDDLGLP